MESDDLGVSASERFLTIYLDSHQECPSILSPNYTFLNSIQRAGHQFENYDWDAVVVS
jgi:hypothetical protein